MSNVVYFRSSKYMVRQYTAFYVYSNSKICIWNNECEVKIYEDSEDFHGAMKTALINDCVICDKSEFDQALKKFEDTLNEIKNQL